MRQTSRMAAALLAIALAWLTGCGGSASPTPAPLSADNVNLIFVVSEDLAYHSAADINPGTASLTSKGLQRSLLMAPFLQQDILGSQNATGIYALEPMTHLQTANAYPDMAAIETIQQFALMNQITLSGDKPTQPPYAGNSYPLNASYASGPLPPDVAPPLAAVPCPNCQGLDFSDENGDNEALVAGIIDGNKPGFYVFSAPWEITSSLLTYVNDNKGYRLAVPTTYAGANFVYAISIAPSGDARLLTYDSKLDPLPTYPELNPPAPLTASCTQQTYFRIAATGGQNGATVPMGTNLNETVYMIRHAEAHPVNYFDDGNYVGAGQWRALDLPNALRGKISPNQVWSIDPAQVISGAVNVAGQSNWAYVRPSLTVEPYAIANNLPYKLVASLEIFALDSPRQTAKYFFNGGAFNNQTVLLAWEHDHIPPVAQALIDSYGGTPQSVPSWPSPDYDTIWTMTLDASGNLTVDNGLCEGIDSTNLPKTPPQF